MQDSVDAIVVGSGLSGGWVAKQLAESGFKVLVLDAGPQITPADLQPDRCTQPMRTASAKRQPIQSQHAAYWSSNPALFVDDQKNPYTAVNPFLWIRSRQIGGRSPLWGGVTLRWSDYEFRDRHSENVAWPIAYTDLAPHYDIVERYLQIEGSRDHLPQLPDGCFEPPPPFTAAEQRFKEQVETSWECRKVIIGRGVPLHNNTARGDVPWPPKANLSNTLCKAMTTGCVSIRPNSVVSHLVMHPKEQTVLGVEVIDAESNEHFTFKGRIVVLCASTIESVRLLLNSACSTHPNGVGNSSGLLGRFLLDHQIVWAAGTIDATQDLPAAPVGGAHCILIPRFKNLAQTDSTFSGAYGIWGGIQRSFGDGLPSSWFLNCILEVLPRAENRVEIDASVTDAWGIPVPRITFTYSDNELRMKKDALSVLRELSAVASLSPHQFGATLPGQYVHELGGARMGSNPDSSVLNGYNQCWDATNLFVVDGSSFVTAGWQNPSLTIMALAVRACDYITESARRGEL